MGIIILFILLAVEMLFLVWSVVTKSRLSKEKSIVRISEFILLAILLITGVLQWGFRYYVITVVLAIQAVIAVIVLIKKREKSYKLNGSIFLFLRSSFLFAFALSLAILCPQNKQPVITGSYEVATAKYTWVDESRIETFSNTGEHRAVTVEFWYPEHTDGNYPLVVFSHGAFGFSGSNESTCSELASNGYIVASINHPYHSFYTIDTNKKFTLVDFDFMNTVMDQNSSRMDEDELIHFENERDWLELRIADENFVLDTILAEVDAVDSDQLFSLIDTGEIGVFGHSLGGASSAHLGRERNDISAVIILDGTMLGEQLAFVDGANILNETPYPVPLLNIYGEDHYTDAQELVGENYTNFYASRNAVCAYEVLFRNTGHLNFTDLPLFSPPLAKFLGMGTVNPRYCIEKTNALVLEFFDCYLKGGPEPSFEKEY